MRVGGTWQSLVFQEIHISLKTPCMNFDARFTQSTGAEVPLQHSNQAISIKSPSFERLAIGSRRRQGQQAGWMTTLQTVVS